MSESDIVRETTGSPATVDSIANDLLSLGVEDGSILIVHASLSSLRWVCGGAVAVVEAIRLAVGPTGTIVMPTQTTGLSDPRHWGNPPVPRAWWPIIRDTMPAFDPLRTPSQGMGAIAECFRTQPGVVRSGHPLASFAAFGALAETIVAEHSINDGLGEHSPLGRLYDCDSSVLLMGVGHDRNTSLHLSEIRALGEKATFIETGAPVLIDGQRQWVQFSEPELDESRFPDIGRAFEDGFGLVRSGKVAQAQTKIMPLPALVDFGTKWLRSNRG